jgi:hypothetical protein
MAYIGNTVQTQGFAPAIDYFNGNGVTVTFTLSRPVVSVAQMIVAIDNVIQNPSSAFSVSGNSITFTSAPLAGTNNIWVEYTSLITTYNAISQDPSVIGDITASGGYLAVGDFGNTYTDGTIVDYVTGNARITTGPADGLTIYNGGTSARTALAAWDTSGNLTNTGAGSFQGVYVGRGAGSVSTNTAVGYQAINANSTGQGGTALGYTALKASTGNFNTGLGYEALLNNTSGANNTAVGVDALYSNTTASNNCAFGGSALLYNTTGTSNVAFGNSALQSNTTGTDNIAIGYQAGYSNLTGTYCTFIGSYAGYSSTSSSNTFVGQYAGYSVTSGTGNCFIGGGSAQASGYYMTTGSKNTILGGFSGNSGGVDIRTSSNQVILSDGDGNIVFRSTGVAGAGVIVMPQVYSSTTGSSPTVYVYGDGTLARSTSALKYKTNIRDLPSKDISKLRAVVYNSKCDNDDKTQDLFGIIADEAQIDFPELVSYGDDGEVEGFKYDRLTAVLLKAIQEQQAMIEELKTKVAALESK